MYNKVEERDYKFTHKYMEHLELALLRKGKFKSTFRVRNPKDTNGETLKEYSNDLIIER